MELPRCVHVDGNTAGSQAASRRRRTEARGERRAPRGVSAAQPRANKAVREFQRLDSAHQPTLSRPPRGHAYSFFELLERSSVLRRTAMALCGRRTPKSWQEEPGPAAHAPCPAPCAEHRIFEIPGCSTCLSESLRRRMGRLSNSAVLVCALACIAVTPAHAHPTYLGGCAHPATGLGPHGAPVADRCASF